MDPPLGSSPRNPRCDRMREHALRSLRCRCRVLSMPEAAHASNDMWFQCQIDSTQRPLCLPDVADDLHTRNLLLEVGELPIARCVHVDVIELHSLRIGIR